MRYVTIKDIAKALGISVSTVSRAFNSNGDIKRETRSLILSAAERMGYKPNPFAHKLLSRRSFNIGVIVPEFVTSFFPEVISGIQKVLIEKNYQVLIMSSNENTQSERENLLTLENNMVDGIIISLTCETQNIPYLKTMVEKGFPMVNFNRVSDELAISKVIFNDYKWAFFATEHLIENGFHKIYHLSGPGHLSISRNRIRGFTDAMNKFHLPVTSANCYEAGLYIEDGIRCMQNLISSGNIPEAIFAFNDPTAIGAMKALKKNGLRIPQDVAIVGFSESSLADLIDPPLTSVAQPTCEMGIKVAELLLHQIEGVNTDLHETVVLNGRLNIRESSMKLP